MGRPSTPDELEHDHLDRVRKRILEGDEPWTDLEHRIAEAEKHKRAHNAAPAAPKEKP